MCEKNLGHLNYGGLPSTVLRQVTIPILTDANCTNTITNTTVQINTDLKVCAGIGGKDTCQGDSGFLKNNWLKKN